MSSYRTSPVSIAVEAGWPAPRTERSLRSLPARRLCRSADFRLGWSLDLQRRVRRATDACCSSARLAGPGWAGCAQPRSFRVQPGADLRTLASSA